MIQLADDIVNGSGEERQLYQYQYQYQHQQVMQMMTLMSISLRWHVRSGQWFSIRIPVLEHLLCRAETLRQEDVDIPWGAGTQDEGNVHQTVLCMQGGCGQLRSPTGCCSELGSELDWRHGLVVPALSFICPLKSNAWPTHYSCGSLQHTRSHVANGTAIIAAVRKRRKIYIARLDKMLRHCLSA